jgi:hypothetical protein
MIIGMKNISYSTFAERLHSAFYFLIYFFYYYYLLNSYFNFSTDQRLQQSYVSC